jgi:hypothetical protein
MQPDEDLSLEALPASGALAFVLSWHERGVDFPISGDGTTIAGSHVR